MKKSLSKLKGFTLIEIIVVLFIVGILAAIALPNIFVWIKKSKSAEGLAALSTYKPQMVACAMNSQGNLDNCALSGCVFTSSQANYHYYNCPSYNTTNFSYTFVVDTLGRIGMIATGLPSAGFKSSDYLDLMVSLIPPNTTSSPGVSCDSLGIFSGVC